MLHPRGQSLSGSRTATMNSVQTRCTLTFRLQGTKEDTSCPKVTSPVCSRTSPLAISEAHWKPFNPWGLSPSLSIAWSFHTLSPLRNLRRAQAGQKPMELLWVRIWPLAVALAPHGDWAGQGTGGTDEGPTAPFHKLRETKAQRQMKQHAQRQGDLASFITSGVGDSIPLAWPGWYSCESLCNLGLLLLHREKQSVPFTPLTCWGSCAGAGHPQSHGVLVTLSYISPASNVGPNPDPAPWPHLSVANSSVSG